MPSMGKPTRGLPDTEVMPSLPVLSHRKPKSSHCQLTEELFNSRAQERLSKLHLAFPFHAAFCSEDVPGD